MGLGFPAVYNAAADDPAATPSADAILRKVRRLMRVIS
jgi:hypothetical protein